MCLFLTSVLAHTPLSAAKLKSMTTVADEERSLEVEEEQIQETVLRKSDKEDDTPRG